MLKQDTQRILLVEDSEADAAIVQFAIAEIRPHVLIELVDSQDGALRWIAEHGVPNALIVDLVLVGTNGRGLITWFRAEHGWCAPVVVFTGSGSPEDHRAALEAGATVVFKKHEHHSLKRQLWTVLGLMDGEWCVPTPR